MKALKGYGREPKRIVAYWPKFDAKGDIVAIAVRSHLYEFTFRSWLDIASQPKSVLFGPDVWWFGPDAGQAGNLSALRQLLSYDGCQVRRGIFGQGRGLWSVDLHFAGEPEPRLCLRDAAPVLGRSVPFVASVTPETAATNLLSDLSEVRDALARQETPFGITLQGSGAAWVRYNLVPGGRGHAQRALSRTNRIGESQMAHHVATGDEAGLAQITEPPWYLPPQSPVRKRPRRWPDDSPKLDAWEWEPRTDAYAEPAYFGARVERWQDRAVRGYVYDVRSAYADAMRWPLPTRFDCIGAGPVPEDGFTICEAAVIVPESVLVPPLPYRLKSGPYAGQVFYPVGAWDGTYTLEELRAAEHLGARVRIKRWFHWESEPWMAPFVDRWWKARRDAESSGLVNESAIAKSMLNGLYGKFAQSDEFETITTDTAEYEAAAERGLNPSRIMIPIDGRKELVALYRIPERRSAALRHVAAAACIAARTRIVTALAMHSALLAGRDLAYVNTDSIATDYRLGCGKDLGDWRVDVAYDAIECLSDRCVAVKVGSDWDIRAAGFAVRRHDGESEARYNVRVNRAWEELRTKGQATMEVLRGLRDGISSGRLHFGTESVRYVVSDRAGIPKRVVNIFGGTRPWTVFDLRRRTGATA